MAPSRDGAGDATSHNSGPDDSGGDSAGNFAPNDRAVELHESSTWI
jgi:hypothetical protein